MSEEKQMIHFYRMEIVYNQKIQALGEVTSDPPPSPLPARTLIPVVFEYEAGSTRHLKRRMDGYWEAKDCLSLGFDHARALKKYLFLLSGQPLENYDVVNTLRRLWLSTEALYQRFGYDAPIQARLIKFNEESREFLQEVRAFDYGNGSGVALMEEGADVLVTLIGVLQKRGVKLEYFLEQCEQVASKNDAKTPETHEIRDGLIARKIAKPARPGDPHFIDLSDNINDRQAGEP